MAEASVWPYTERNGVNASDDVEALLRDPEVYLDDAEKAEAFAFAHGLFTGYLSDELRVAPLPGDETVRDLKAIKATSTTDSRQTFYADYFKTEAAQDDAAALGLDLEADEPIRDQLYALSVGESATNAKMRKQIAARSLRWYKQELADRLMQDKAQDASQPDSEKVTVEFDPTTFFKKFNELQAYRVFYRQASKALREEAEALEADQLPTALNAAKTALLNMHFARVNGLVADMYPHMHDVSLQISRLPRSPLFDDWRSQLIAAAPIAAAVLERDEAERAQYVSDHLRRLDLLRNGAAAWDDTHDYLPISHEVAALADELSQSPSEDAPAAHLDPDMIEYMQSIRWNADQMKEFCEKVLHSWGFLSEHQADWEAVGKRSGASEDGKWQVVISPKVSSLSVNGDKKTVTVPEDYDRTLIQVSKAGALPGAAHELSHLWQNEFSYRLAEQIPLAGIKGKRYVTGYEMGGIEQEREVHAMVGQVRPTNSTYLRALQAKLQGGNQTQAARAFAEAKGGDITEEIAEVAGKDVLRLYRGGGHDSQALDYIEQELMLRSLSSLSPGEVRAVAIAGGSFSLRDAATLHKFGLLDLPREIHVQPAQDVIEIFLRDYYYA